LLSSKNYSDDNDIILMKKKSCHHRGCSQRMSCNICIERSNPPSPYNVLRRSSSFSHTNLKLFDPPQKDVFYEQPPVEFAPNYSEFYVSWKNKVWFNRKKTGVLKFLSQVSSCEASYAPVCVYRQTDRF
jgi:hypothetical protein